MRTEPVDKTRENGSEDQSRHGETKAFEDVTPSSPIETDAFQASPSATQEINKQKKDGHLLQESKYHPDIWKYWRASSGIEKLHDCTEDSGNNRNENYEA